MSKKDVDYLAFVLRLYRAGEQSGAPVPDWRVSLENARTHQRQGFAGLEDMFEFLAQKIDQMAQDEEASLDSSKVADIAI